jgi:hypothetical protein
LAANLLCAGARAPNRLTRPGAAAGCLHPAPARRNRGNFRRTVGAVATAGSRLFRFCRPLSSLPQTLTGIGDKGPSNRTPEAVSAHRSCLRAKVFRLMRLKTRRLLQRGQDLRARTCGVSEPLIERAQVSTQGLGRAAGPFDCAWRSAVGVAFIGDAFDSRGCAGRVLGPCRRRGRGGSVGRGRGCSSSGVT